MQKYIMTFSFGAAILLWSLEGHTVVPQNNERMIAHPASHSAGSTIQQRDVNLKNFHTNHPEARPKQGAMGSKANNAAGTMNVGCYAIDERNNKVRKGMLYNVAGSPSPAKLRDDCFVSFTGCRSGSNQPDCFTEIIDSSKSQQRK